MHDSGDEQPTYTLKQYDDFVRRTDHASMSNYATCAFTGLAAEAGEVVQLYNKALRNEEMLHIDSLVLELGDVLWYVTRIAGLYGWTLQEILDMNVEKLKERHGGSI